MKNFVTRTITGILFVVVVVGSIYIHPLVSATLFLIIAMMAYRELTNLLNYDLPRILFTPGFISGILLYIILALTAFKVLPAAGIFLLIPLLVIVPGYELASGQKPTWKSLLAAWAAIAYAFLPFALTNFYLETSYPFSDHNPFMLLSVLVIIWANDVFAYLGGNLYGRHRLAPVISPKKTWEGTLTGVVFSVLTGIVIANFNTYLFLNEWIILSLIISVSGVFGDLGESRLKRSVRTKDSGAILPGHGGVLDRFDAFIFAVPSALVYILIMTS